MVIAAVIALWLVIGLGSVVLFRTASRRARTYERFAEATANAEDSGSAAEVQLGRGVRRLSRNWIWLPWVVGLAAALTVWLVFGWPIQYVAAIGGVVALLLNQLEGSLHKLSLIHI